MRAFLHRNKWFTYLVIGLFLLATSGTALSRMTCLEGGHTVLSLGLAVDCCPEEAPVGHPTFKASCCELAFVQGDRADYLPNSNADALVSGLMLAVLPTVTAVPEPVSRLSWLGSRPPPIDTRERLCVIGVQRV